MLRVREGATWLLDNGSREASPLLFLILSLERTFFSFSIRNGASSARQLHICVRSFINLLQVHSEMFEM